MHNKYMKNTKIQFNFLNYDEKKYSLINSLMQHYLLAFYCISQSGCATFKFTENQIKDSLLSWIKLTPRLYFVILFTITLLEVF